MNLPEMQLKSSILGMHVRRSAVAGPVSLHANDGYRFRYYLFHHPREGELDMVFSGHCQAMTDEIERRLKLRAAEVSKN